MAPFLLRIPIVLAFIASILAMPSQAADTTPSALSPSQDQTPVLTLINTGERRQISRAQIETSPLYEVVLQHFEGVKEVLRVSGWMTLSMPRGWTPM